MNLNTNPGFEAALDQLMKLRGIKTKSEAIRVAVHEALERAEQRKVFDYRAWVGLGRGPDENPAPRFHDEDSLWEADGC